jgi:hypothetical protein
MNFLFTFTNVPVNQTLITPDADNADINGLTFRMEYKTAHDKMNNEQ